MSQYQRMVSYLYEYKQGVKGVNVGYVRIEQRGTGCRISLQMRGRNLGQLSDVSVFRQRRGGIRYYTIGTLTERNGDYRCRIETESENLLGSGINFSDVDGIVLYQDDTYYVATTWKNQSVYLGESRTWDPEEPEDPEELENIEAERAKSEEITKDEQMALEQNDIQAIEQEMSQQSSERNDFSHHEQEILEQNSIQQIVDGDGSENYGQQIAHRDDAENYEQKVAYRDRSENHRRGDCGGNER
ncbi:MAG: hypothetical protein K2K70_06275, partial [Lachnospiraceae bacterium]|nr:hypothetical protein [Lachnospiraceae bacterium]